MKEIEDLKAIHDLFGEGLEALEKSLYEESKKAEKQLSKDEVKTTFIVEPDLVSFLNLSALKDLEDIYSGSPRSRLHPLAKNEGATDFGGPVNIKTLRQTMISNALFDHGIMRGERVISVPTMVLRLTRELINCPELLKAVEIRLGDQWATGINHWLNGLFSLNHPPIPVAVQWLDSWPDSIVTRHKFDKKQILWYRFTDVFLNDLSWRKKNPLGFRQSLKSFGVKVDGSLLCKGLGLINVTPVHPLLRWE